MQAIIRAIIVPFLVAATAVSAPGDAPVSDDAVQPVSADQASVAQTDGRAPGVVVAIDESPSPEQIVARAAQAYVNIAKVTPKRIRFRAELGVNLVDHLDANDAPVPVLLKAGEAARTGVNTVAMQGLGAIGAVTEGALQALQDAGGDAEDVEALASARAQAVGAIGASRQVGTRIINVNLAQALADEGDGGQDESPS